MHSGRSHEPFTLNSAFQTQITKVSPLLSGFDAQLDKAWPVGQWGYTHISVPMFCTFPRLPQILHKEELILNASLVF